MGRRPDREAKRSEVLSLRIEQRLRYLADLAARQQHRNITGFTEWAIEEALKQIRVTNHLGAEVSLSDLAGYLWSDVAADRIGKLALTNPHLLTHEEQVVWRLARENREYWNYQVDEAGNIKIIDDDQHFIWKKFRHDLPMLLAVARGEASEDSLPKPQPVPVVGKLKAIRKS